MVNGSFSVPTIGGHLKKPQDVRVQRRDGGGGQSPHPDFLLETLTSYTYVIALEWRGTFIFKPDRLEKDLLKHA